MIYLDNSATTKPWKSVLETYKKVSETYFANPSSLHPAGREAERLLQQARAQTASLLEAEANEVIFTSGATEANNLAIQGTVKANMHRGNHIITTAVEHPSVLRTMEMLEKNGCEVTYLFPDQTGEITAAQVKEAVRENTILVSVMHVNNETGSIQPVEEIGKLLTSFYKINYHVDYVQGVGKVPLSFKKSFIDLMSISGHKFHSVKGTGALIVKEGTNISGLQLGGGQEKLLRAGTENTAGAAAMAKALRLALDKIEEIPKMRSLLLQLEKHLKQYPDILINSPARRAPHILNFSVIGRKPETLVNSLAAAGIMISTTSACNSKLEQESTVLKAMSLPNERTVSSLRISLSYDSTKKEIQEFMKVWDSVYDNLLKAGERR